jgi:hypothetical protein
MHGVAVLRKIASWLMFLGVATVVLTIVQPKHPEVDKMFRIGAAIAFVVGLAMHFGSNAIERGMRGRQPSQESPKQPAGEQCEQE